MLSLITNKDQKNMEMLYLNKLNDLPPWNFMKQ